MRSFWLVPAVAFCGGALVAACSSAPPSSSSAATSGTGGASASSGASTGGTAVSAGGGAATTTSATTGTGANGGAPPATAGSGGEGGAPADVDAGDSGPSMDGGSPPADSLGANRDRLLGTYLDYLKATAPATQSNGLSGGNLSSVCELWDTMDPSSRATFLTLTARMQGSTLGADGSSMLAHVTKAYRIVGGQGANANDPGSCGGGEYNRMMMSMDAALHDALVAADHHAGANQPNGKPDIADVQPGTSWRDTHDLAGPHSPFTLSAETNQGAPRGQTQLFEDPASKEATSPLGRMDLDSLVDPYALEMDQDYDCFHNSNPLCTYVLYGPLCAPEASAIGTDVYTKSYGSIDPGWHPSGCGP